jgi:thiamine pyrophosphate-dependent acetolactate synthase large subunit-like protein
MVRIDSRSPSAEAVARIVQGLADAKQPGLLIGRVSSAQEDWDNRIALAERTRASVVTDVHVAAEYAREASAGVLPELSRSAAV